MDKRTGIPVIDLIFMLYGIHKGGGKAVWNGMKVLFRKPASILLSYLFFVLAPVLALIIGLVLASPFTINTDLFSWVFLLPVALLAVFGFPFMVGFYISMVKQTNEGENISLSKAFNDTFSRYLSLFITNTALQILFGILMAVLIVFGILPLLSNLNFSSFLVLIVVGIIIGILFLTYLYLALGSGIHLMVDDSNVLDAINASVSEGFLHYKQLVYTYFVLNGIFAVSGYILYLVPTPLNPVYWGMIVCIILVPFEFALLVTTAASFYYNYDKGSDEGDVQADTYGSANDVSDANKNPINPY
jgi:hypothetical protein